MFVISIKRLFDCLGNKLEKPEYEYFGYNWCAGSFSSSDFTWESFYHAETFKTAEEAKEVYMENLHILTCDWKDYDRDSIRICEVKIEPLESRLKLSESLPWKLDKE